MPEINTCNYDKKIVFLNLFFVLVFIISFVRSPGSYIELFFFISLPQVIKMLPQDTKSLQRVCKS